jgi:hypothetical protein
MDVTQPEISKVTEGYTFGFARIIIPTTAWARPTATDPETTTAPAHPRYPVV